MQLKWLRSICTMLISILMLDTAYAATQVPTKGLISKCWNAFQPTISDARNSLSYAEQNGIYRSLSMPRNLWGEYSHLIFDSFTGAKWLLDGQKLYQMDMKDPITNKYVDKGAGYIVPAIGKKQREADYQLNHMGSFKFGNKTYRIAQFNEKSKGVLFWEGTYYLGIYEVNKQYPAYFVKMRMGSIKPNLKIHQDETGVMIYIPYGTSYNFIIDIRNKPSRLLENKNYRRSYLSKKAELIQPEFHSETNKDWSLYAYGLKTFSGIFFPNFTPYNANKKLPSFKNSSGEEILIIGPLWKADLGKSPDTIVLFNRERGEIEKTIELQESRYIAGEAFVESNGFFSLPEKRHAHYTDLKVKIENNEVYFWAKERTASQNSKLQNRDSYNPLESFIVHKVSSGEQIITFKSKTDGTRIFANEKGEIIEAPQKMQRIMDKANEIFLEDKSQ